MKNILVILLLCISLSVSGATYYLSPSGNDSNPGTLSQPFFSLNKAWTVVSAGDIVYLRGGTYSYTSQQRLLGKSGTSSNIIKVWAYPGETPVITRGNSWSWTDFRAGVFFMGNYCHFKGIQITGFDQRDDFVWTAMRCEDFNNNTFEFMDFSWSGLGSYMTGSCNNNLFLNCDWHDNFDPMTNYENADGLNFEGVKSGGSNTVRGCRFWNNSDDGLDIYDNDSYLLVENCWAWNQGYQEDGVSVAADGNGFKLGPTTISAKSTVLRKVVNCISFHNQSWGYNQNGDALCNMELYNNISYNNSFGSNWGGGFNFNVSGVAYYIKNNISYKDVPEAVTLGVKTNVNHNSWDGSVTVTNSDFVSLDGSELAQPRKADGSLPDINFLRLAAGSDLLDAGVNVGLAYTGTNPDLGPNEIQTGTVVTPNPAFLSASIENGSPSLLTMNYDLTLNNNVIPAASSFSVLVNSQGRSVNSIAVSDKKVILTLSSAAKSGDVVTVAYTKPAANPLQTSSGKEAATISAQKVTNNVQAINPVYLSSVIENATPAVLEMSYDLTLANKVPAASAFKVMVNSSSRSISAVTVSGSKVMLTLSSPVVYGNTVTVAYTKPATNPLQTSAGAQAATISAQKVTNNVRSATLAFISASIENATPTILSMTYNLTLSNTVPAASAFKVQVNSTSRSVKSVAISGTQVLLTMSTPFVYGNTVTVSYTKPSSNPLQTSAGAQAATMSAQKVTNYVQSTAPVYVSSVIENATPTILAMTYNLVLANKVPAASAFKVLVNSISRSVSSVAISGAQVLLTLSSPVVYGNTVTISYTKPASNPLQTSTGAQAVTISAQAVKNNTISQINVAPSVAITSPVNSSTFTSPTDITITASASDTDGTITLVEFYSGTTLLGSDAISPYSFIWSAVSEGIFSITATATDNKGAKTTSSAISVSVANETAPPVANQPPVVSISNPSKGNKFFTPADIEIEVIAADPDGSISKVELFNGTVRLAELTTAPYSYTWKGVSAGTYKLKAVATDNLNATTTTSMVDLSVGEKTKYDAASEIINLYPNPNNGNFNIEFLDPSKTEKSEIVISDLGGKQIYHETISAEETTKQFDLQNIRSGIYIMTVSSKEIIVTKKIIVRQ